MCGFSSCNSGEFLYLVISESLAKALGGGWVPATGRHSVIDKLVDVLACLYMIPERLCIPRLCEPCQAAEDYNAKNARCASQKPVGHDFVTGLWEKALLRLGIGGCLGQ